LATHIGDVTACPQYERNLILFYVEKRSFCAFDYILREIKNISVSPLQSCRYAPQIMMMIEKVSGLTFVKDVFITDMKPQATTEPTISKDVPSTSTAPTIRFSTTPSSSSGDSSLLRLLKSMFRMCQDTRQRQDILLSNQHLQNEKINIDEIDDFPFVEPPLDGDPFASLTLTDLAAMGATLGSSTTSDDDDDNEYEGGEDDGEDDDDE
jgi:hypothetical protein